MIDKCKVFTPKEYVEQLLDYVDYKKNLYGKKVIENACGDGGILKVIVYRYIQDCLMNNLSLSKIKKGIMEDIYGTELDEIHYKNCLKKLDEVAKTFGIKGIKWNVLNENVLKKEWDIKFDFVIGNPPYIAYRDLTVDVRAELKAKYISCKKGNFDYCYAFIEESLKCLNENGKMAYLIPNSIFKNVFGKNLRKVLLPFITQIVDYKQIKVFENALVSAAIIVCDKKKIKSLLEYKDIANGLSIKLQKSDLSERWFFERSLIEDKNFLKFGNYFNVSMSAATLCNEAFVIDNYTLNDNYVIVDDTKIEKLLTRKAASPLMLKKDKKARIIFPYYYIDGKLKKYEEKQFYLEFPEGTKYLMRFKDKLLKRDSDKKANWFEYGRTQALAHFNCEKLLFSALITNKINIYKLSEDYIPYSGIYVTSKLNLSLDIAKKILESDEFLKYVKKVGTNGNSNTLKIGVNDISNYTFSEDLIK